MDSQLIPSSTKKHNENLYHCNVNLVLNDCSEISIFKFHGKVLQTADPCRKSCVSPYLLPFVNDGNITLNIFNTTYVHLTNAQIARSCKRGLTYA